jgi:long-chain acyl-CoA synthetase
MSTLGERYPGAWSAVANGRPAVICPHDGTQMTYPELDDYAWRLARVLHAHGVRDGARAAILLENRLEYPAVQWGVHYAGALYVPLSTRLKAAEVAYIVADSAARVVFVSGRTDPEVVAALRALDPAPALLTLDAATPAAAALGDLLADVPGDPIPGAAEGGDMIYSSGTTGRPKGILPALSGLPVGSTSMIGDLLVGLFGVTPESVYLSPAPMYHAAPSKWVHAITSVGATAVLMDRFDPARSLELIERHRVTHSQWVPTMFQRMLRLPDAERARWDTSSQVAAIHAAAPCPPEVKRQMIAWWGPIITEYYGGSEAIGMCMASSAEWLERPGTVGRAGLGELHIVDDEGNERPVGEEGLVCFAGGRPLSYHNDPDKTAEAHLRPGWATMGDIGRVDSGGYLYLTDRRSNLIITGGVNVYPQETEDTLLAHPAVLDAAVVGLPHEDFGEQVVAFVQPAPDATAGDALAAELIAFCRARIADVKCPRRVEFRAELPREPNGKLLKRTLRQA